MAWHTDGARPVASRWHASGAAMAFLRQPIPRGIFSRNPLNQAPLDKRLPPALEGANRNGITRLSRNGGLPLPPGCSVAVPAEEDRQQRALAGVESPLAVIRWGVCR